MSKKTITNISGFVIIFLIALASSGCTFVSSGADVPATGQTYLPPVVVGTIRSTDITESSGLAASRCQNNVLWTHNDSGDDAFIFALDVKGNTLGTWKVANATNVDWEDIASYKDKAGKCYLYIGEIGDNKTKRPEHIVYRVSEPIVTTSSALSTRKEPLSTAVAEEIRFMYPDYNQDAETLLVHPLTAAIYIVTKRVSGPAGVYRILPDFGSGETQKAEAVGQLAVPAIPNGLVTGGDISPDGKHLIICDYTRAYEFSVPANAANFDEIWKQDAIAIDVGQRKVGEAICYSVDGNSVFATSEKKDPPLIEIKRRK